MIVENPNPKTQIETSSASNTRQLSGDTSDDGTYATRAVSGALGANWMAAPLRHTVRNYNISDPPCQ